MLPIVILGVVVVFVFGFGGNETEPPGSERGIRGWEAVNAGAGGWGTAG